MTTRQARRRKKNTSIFGILVWWLADGVYRWGSCVLDYCRRTWHAFKSQPNPMTIPHIHRYNNTSLDTTPRSDGSPSAHTAYGQLRAIFVAWSFQENSTPRGNHITQLHSHTSEGICDEISNAGAIRFHNQRRTTLSKRRHVEP